MYFENCDCTICLDICPDQQKVNEICLEYIQTKYPQNCDEENLLHYLKSLVASSLILRTITLVCNHKFHLKCILPLMKIDITTVKCPNCRRYSKVRQSQDYEVVNNFQMIQFFHKILRDRINACKIEHNQNFFPLSKIQQKTNIAQETTDAIYQAFIQFKNLYTRLQNGNQNKNWGPDQTFLRLNSMNTQHKSILSPKRAIRYLFDYYFNKSY